jgi:homocysteine S-methyltransferase
MLSFLERLQKGPLLGDGAIGTLLYGRGFGFDQCLEALVVAQPQLIAAIHEEYVRAGADLITTHTFGANRLRLTHHGLADKVSDLNRRAVALVRELRVVTGEGFLIAGNVGPVGKRLKWADPQERSMVANAYGEQIALLAEAGVDLLLFETFSDVAELEVAIEQAKATSALPIVASMSYGEDGLTLAGQAAGEVATRLAAAGVDVIGANCSVGPAQMVETLREMVAAAPQAIFSVTPNAGLPIHDEDSELCYPVGARAFAEYVPQFLKLGARVVGGCCGTTPEYVAAIRRAMDRVDG